MKATIHWNQHNFEVDLSKPIDISIPLKNGNDNPNGFYIDAPRFEPVRVGSFVGSVAEGAGCNCENLYINAHGNGTHTECVGHISLERITINQCLKQFYSMAQLISVAPKLQSNGDYVVMLEDVKHLLHNDIEALVLRTLPNISDKLHKAYSGTNPTYVEPALTAYLCENNIKHFLLDLPSVDREEDEGKLEAHHAFWNYPNAPRLDATITEFIYVKNEVKDGRYLLNLQIASFESDASPSKPVLYAIS